MEIIVYQKNNLKKLKKIGLIYNKFNPSRIDKLVHN